MNNNNIYIISCNINNMPSSIDDDLRILVQTENPKKYGTSSYKRYEKYKVASTIGEARRLGATATDIRFDRTHGYISLPGLTDLNYINTKMFELIKQNEMLSQRLQKVEQQLKETNKRTDYIELLDEYKPKKSFQEFCDSSGIFTIHKEVFEYLYNDKLFETVKRTFYNYFDNNDPPIRCFAKKPNTFYIYNGTVWELDKDSNNVHNMFKNIIKSLTVYFVNWEDECYKDGSDKIMLLYIDVNTKIYCDVKNVLQKLKHMLFNDLKCLANC